VRSKEGLELRKTTSPFYVLLTYTRTSLEKNKPSIEAVKIKKPDPNNSRIWLRRRVMKSNIIANLYYTKPLISIIPLFK
jgi:hypothetical protein